MDEAVWKRKELAYSMIDYTKVKLIIWDLDETFWKGTLSEGAVEAIPEHIRLIHRLTDCGIVNAVCSKNDEAPAMKKLKELGVAEEFVFNSINWEAKGERIRQLIMDMKLRSVNVLFLDDNAGNRKEAEYYNEGLMTGGPEEIPALFAYAESIPAKDEEHKRLKSYRVLEEKREAMKQSSSNEAFLMESNIKVVLHKDCLSELPRVTELIQRTNQLNYTKKRLNEKEVEELFQNPAYECGYVTAEDKFGSYGIVGFYAKKGEKLEHFLFSCRTLGMAVEQYVYAKLGYPELTVEGEVVSMVKKDFLPPWINQDRELVQEGKQTVAVDGRKQKILFKGPCDLNSLFAFLEESDSIDSEFTYISSKTGVNIEQVNHSTQIVESYTLSEAQKKMLVEELPFADEDMFSDRLFTEHYDIVCMSYLADCNLGVYRRKETGERVAFVPGYYPITEKKNWQKYINREIYTSRFTFTEPFLEWFSKQYEFEGILTPDEILENIRFIREHLAPDTLLILILGAEIPFKKNRNPAYEGRHLVQKEVNDRIRRLAEENENITFLDINRYIKGQESFYDQFNHFVQEVYYEMAKDLVKVVAEKKSIELSEKSRTFMRVETWKEDLRMIKNRILRRKK